MATGDDAQTVDVVTPAAGESVTEGTILEWRVGVGDPIKVDDTIVEISTDKVDIELPSPATGTVTEILIAEGETVTVGQVIARISLNGAVPAGDGAAAASTAAAAGAATGAAAGGATSATAAPPAASAPTAPTTVGAAPAAAEAPEGRAVSPVAARAAAAEGVKLEGIEGTGPGGRIMKTDVLEAAGNGAQPNGAAATAAPADGAGVAQLLKGGAAALARYMDQSRSIPTATSFRTIAVSTLDARRRELKAAGHKVSFTHVIAYAIVRAAEEMPVMRHHFEEIEGKPHRVD